MEEKNLTTVGKEASAEFTEKKSVFIGYTAPVQNADEAEEFIRKIKKKHADARHNVSAYVIGNAIRYSDDGEPKGTGGVPVLEVIKKSGVDGTVVVVTRYFGGILLGAAGLVRAYSKAAAMAIEAMNPIASFSDNAFGADEDGAELGEVIADTDSEDEFERLRDRIAISEAIKKMPELWQKIVLLRYYRDRTQQQTADALGLSQVKISREEKKIVEFLRGELL